MKLSDREKIDLVNIRNRYKAAIEKRCKNPSSFREIISYFRAIALEIDRIEVIVAQRRADVDHYKRKIAKAGANLFTIIHGKNQVLHLNKIIDKAFGIVFDHEFKEFKALHFGLERRIKDLSYDSKVTVTRFKGNGVEGINASRSENYTVTFSDDRHLELHSLNDEKALRQARELFDAKIQELENPQSIVTLR